MSVVRIRPGGGEGAARIVYDGRRLGELKRERAEVRDAELERLARRIDLLDMKLPGLSRLRTLELRGDLERAGFDVTGLRPIPYPTDVERAARRRRGRAEPSDPVMRARAEEAADRGRLVRTFTPRITIR